MTKEETLEKLELVINRIAPKYCFAGYDIDDMKQEAYIICMDALERYDEKRPLENFLSVNLANRLKNFIRDNHCKSGETDKKKIMCPSQMPHSDIAVDENINPEDIISMIEIKEIIEEKMPARLRMSYLKMVNGVSINKSKKEEVINFLKETFSGEF